MKKVYSAIIVIVFIALIIISCEPPPSFRQIELTRGRGADTGSDPGPKPDNKMFWAQDFTNNTFYEIEAERLAANFYCEVWVEAGSGITETQAQEAADEYLNSIYPKMMNVFSWTANFTGYGVRNVMQYADILGNEDGRLTLLLLDIKDGYVQGVSEGYVAGYFWSGNFYDNKFFQSNPLYYSFRSNEQDMIYIDTNPGLNPSNKTNTYRTVAHEMQHLMNFATTNLYASNYIRTKTLEDWIDEGLSSAAEWVYSRNHTNGRVEWYNSDPSGLIKKGNNFFVWGNHKTNESAQLDDYATVYMFFQYLRLQYSSDIYFNILTARNHDYRAITNNINKSWDALLGDWLAANYLNLSTGPYGYMNESGLTNLTKHYYYDNTSSAALYPGEGVFSYVSDAYTVPANSGVTRYMGISATGIVSSVPAGGALLTFNANTNIEGASVTTIVTGENKDNLQTAEINSARSVNSSDAASSFGPMPISARDVLRRNGHEYSEIDAGFIKKIKIKER